MALTNTARNDVYNKELRNTNYTSVTTWYLALCTSATASTASTAGTEVTGGSYARQTVAFDAPTNGADDNTAAVEFADMPSCTVRYWELWDAATNGNRRHFGQFAQDVVVSAGATFRIAAGALDMSVT